MCGSEQTVLIVQTRTRPQWRWYVGAEWLLEDCGEGTDGRRSKSIDERVKAKSACASEAMLCAL